MTRRDIEASFSFSLDGMLAEQEPEMTEDEAASMLWDRMTRLTNDYIEAVRHAQQEVWIQYMASQRADQNYGEQDYFEL